MSELKDKIAKLPKWAQKHIEEMEIRNAFRLTDAVEPDVPIPASGLSSGFTFNPYDKGRVMHSISSFNAHGTGWLARGALSKTSIQQPIQQYSTKSLAAKALRHAIEIECAERLAVIDRMIANFETEERL